MEPPSQLLLFVGPIVLWHAAMVVPDPRNEFMREIVSVTRDVSEAMPLSYLRLAPIEFVTRLGWAERRQKKPLVVDVVDDGFLRYLFQTQMWSL